MDVQTLTFRQWLRKQRLRDDMVGDLARDAFADAAWTGKTPLSLRRRMRQSGHACDEAFEALDEARDQWLQGWVPPSHVVSGVSTQRAAFESP